MGTPNNLTTFQKDQLIQWFFQYLSWGKDGEKGTRGHLMQELPAAYNAYCGEKIVKVVRTSDGTELGSNGLQTLRCRQRESQ